MRRRWFVLALFAASACANLDGLTGGPSDAGGNAPSNIDASVTDATSTDAVTADRSTVGPEVDAGVAFCDRDFDATVYFCTGFDAPDGNAANGFTSTVTGLKGTTAEAMNGAVVFTVVSQPQAVDVAFKKNILEDAAASDARFSVSAVITVPPNNKSTFPMLGLTLPVGDAGNAYEVRLRASNGSVQLQETVNGTEFFASVFLGAAPSGERWEITLARVSDITWTLSLTRDGASLYRDNSHVGISGVGLTVPSIRIGAFDTMGPSTVTLDNVLVTH